MPTPAKVGGNRHKQLVAEDRAVNDLLRSLAEALTTELREQGRLARPSLERIAVLTAQISGAVDRQRRIEDEMHSLLAGAAEPLPDREVRRLQQQIDELRQALDQLRNE